MTIATVTLYDFDRLATRFWMLGQMQLAQAPLSRVDGLTFFKLCGTARDFSSPMRADLSRFGLVAAGESAEAAARGFRDAPVLRRLEARAAGVTRFRLTPISTRGKWSGAAPFGDAPGDPAAADVMPIAALTRARIRPRGMRRFWGQAPAVNDMIAADPNVIFALGMGEAPWRNQLTFSIWPDVAAMRAFAGSAAHRRAAADAFAEGWFSEDLFARFRVDAAEGPLAPRALAA